MPVVSQADVRRTETPNAVMHTLASPTLGASRSLAVWRVEMAPGAQGPAHRFDVEQVWTAVAGAATFDLEDGARRIRTGDTVVLPAGVPRRVMADAADGFAALVAGRSGGRALLPDGTDRGVPAWIA